MRSNVKLKTIVLITIEIFFVLGLLITINPSLSTSNNNVIKIDNEKLKLSELSEKIYIINNSGWVDFRNAGNCTGSGTYSDPYIIENLKIDAGGVGSPIWVENSNVYFIIKNCSVYNSHWGPDLTFDAGIRLLNVNNSQLIGNNCTSNYVGIDLNSGCYNNTITGNIVNTNGGGILLCDNLNNTVSGNIVNNNLWSGIYLLGSNYTIVSGNTINENKMHGIQMSWSHNNRIISGNTINENKMVGIRLEGDYNNTLSRNTINNNNWRGIELIDSTYITISENILNNNNESGIIFFQSNYNTISGNTAKNNTYGIILFQSNYNTIMGNTLIGNDECIFELDCQGNVIQDNVCSLAPSLNYFPIILTISITIVVISVFIIDQNRKKFKKVNEELDFL
jgi:parallel beta-helix repeat protein